MTSSAASSGVEDIIGLSGTGWCSSCAGTGGGEWSEIGDDRLVHHVTARGPGLRPGGPLIPARPPAGDGQGHLLVAPSPCHPSELTPWSGSPGAGPGLTGVVGSPMTGSGRPVWVNWVLGWRRSQPSLRWGRCSPDRPADFSTEPPRSCLFVDQRNLRGDSSSILRDTTPRLN
jgi:hypothetical protein